MELITGEIVKSYAKNVTKNIIKENSMDKLKQTLAEIENKIQDNYKKMSKMKEGKMLNNFATECVILKAKKEGIILGVGLMIDDEIKFLQKADIELSIEYPYTPIKERLSQLNKLKEKLGI